MSAKLLHCTGQINEMQSENSKIFTIKRAVTLPMLTLLCCLGVGCAEANDVQTKGDIELGAHLSSTCAGCHSNSAEDSAIPPLETLSPDDIITALSDYKSGTRDNATMRTIAASLTQQDIDALVAYFVHRQKTFDKTKKQ
ncbi:MAG: c-type cytochrome [Hyphomicrobiaceae bacterium]